MTVTLIKARKTLSLIRITNADRRIPDHPLIGTERVYREFQSWHVPEGNGNGIVVVGNGMTVYVTDAFHDWNGVPGLDMLAVNVNETRCRTHVTPADIGWSGPLLTDTLNNDKKEN